MRSLLAEETKSWTQMIKVLQFQAMTVKALCQPRVGQAGLQLLSAGLSQLL